jgi:hypothetical protein
MKVFDVRETKSYQDYLVLKNSRFVINLLRVSAHRPYLQGYKNIYFIQQDATLHSLFYLETALHVSRGTTINHQERIQLYLQHLVFVTPLLLSAAILEELELV